jgi:hypothetical protein
MERITITEALSKVKLVDKKISKKITGAKFIGVKKGDKILDGFEPESAKEDLQSIEDLISYRFKLKNAIHESNQKTKLTIAGKEYTVAQAIEFKEVVLYKTHLLAKLKAQLDNIRDDVNYENEKVQARLDEQVSKLFEKPTKEEVETFSKSFLKANEYSLVDPIEIDKKIKEYEEEIDNFLTEVDFRLSTSNATTFIEV